MEKREAVFSVTLTSAEGIIRSKCQKAERELKVEKRKRPVNHVGFIKTVPE